jgi:hypothetical protein
MKTTTSLAVNSVNVKMMNIGKGCGKTIMNHKGLEDIMEYEVEYTVRQCGCEITLDTIYPASDYVEEMFYNGTLFRTVNLDEDGKYRLHIHLAEDGYLSINELEEYLGWVCIEH